MKHTECLLRHKLFKHYKHFYRIIISCLACCISVITLIIFVKIKIVKHDHFTLQWNHSITMLHTTGNTKLNDNNVRICSPDIFHNLFTWIVASHIPYRSRLSNDYGLASEPHKKAMKVGMRNLRTSSKVPSFLRRYFVALQRQLTQTSSHAVEWSTPREENWDLQLQLEPKYVDLPTSIWTLGLFQKQMVHCPERPCVDAPRQKGPSFKVLQLKLAPIRLLNTCSSPLNP